MRYYDIYLMDEEVTRLYFGREGILFRLFQENEIEKDNERKMILKKQIEYITNPIPLATIRRLLISKRFTEGTNREWRMQTGNEDLVSLEINQHLLRLKVQGDLGPETVVFEILRNAFSDFFAIDYQNVCGAWLKPHKNSLLYKRQLIL